METTRTAPPDAISALISDWKVSLRARGRSRQTIGSYLTVADSFAAYLARMGMPTSVASIAREHVEHYLADMLERGLAPATVAKHYRSLQQLFKWLVDEGEVPHSPMERMSPPTVPEQPVPVLDDGALASLLASCKGDRKSVV